MVDIEEKVNGLCTKLVNGEIRVADIPDELFIPVAKRAIYDLPAPTMGEMAARLSSLVDRLKGKVSQNQQLLVQKIDELDQKMQELEGIRLMEEAEGDAICSKEQMKEEASFRLAQLVNDLGLNPNVVKYWNEGRLYYSYLTAGGFMGSIDKIEYDSKNVAVVKQFEKEFDCMVYHVIESNGTLILLSVSNDADDWGYGRLEGNRIVAYVHNFDFPDQSEFGDVVLSSLHGALVQIG